ncbi:MAG: hypothetical protein DCC55_11925 [Chloroflexi bacterium]|nr:MAG: hypothetical protein DCC55_11925 [Chloroflexota bacterium]
MSARIFRLLIAVLLLTALGLRLWRIDMVPPGFHFDEAFEGLEAWRILHDPGYRPLFLTGNFGVLPLNVYANALTFALFDLFGGTAGPAAMRVTAALFGTLTVITLYGLAYELRLMWPSQLTVAYPFFAAATLAVMRWHLHFSRMGIEPILTPLLWAGATWLMLRGWRTGSWLSFAGCGVLLAAAMYAYQGAWVIPLLAAMMAVVLILGRTEIEKRRFEGNYGDWRNPRNSPQISSNLSQSSQITGLALAAVVATFLFAPLAWYFWQHPDQFLLRPAQIAVVGAGGAPATVGEMAWATAKMFGPFGAPGDQDPRRNLPGAPALNLWLAAPFYLGLVLALLRVRRPAYGIPLAGLIGLLLPGVLSEYAPHFHRIVGATAPVALLCGFGFDWLWQQAGRTAQIKHLMRGVVVTLFVLGALLSVRDYFVRWTALPDLFYAFDVGLWKVGQRIAAQPPEQTIYLTPRDAGHPTIAFAIATAPGKGAQPVSFDGRYLFPLAADSNNQPELYIVIEHEDFRTPLLLPEIFLDARVIEEITDQQGRVYARFYKRPSQSVPQRPPQHRKVAKLGDGIELAGYDVQPGVLRRGELLYLQLHWLVKAPPSGDWTVFTHVVAQDEGGERTVVAGHDSRPGAGSLPTDRWRPGWRILDEYQIPLPADLPTGRYELEIGLYQPTGERLPAGQESIVLGEVTIE